MNIDHLRYFLETARREHLGRAASAVNISPSAVSHAISSLEAELGRELFVRKGKGIHLTSHGKALMERAGRFINELEALKDEIASERIELQGYYRLAAAHVLCAKVLVPSWNAVQKGNRGLISEMYTLRSAQVVAGVASGEYDLGLCFSPQDHPSLELETLYRGDLLLVVRKGHPVLRTRDPRGLSAYPAVLPKAFQGIDNCERHIMFDRFRIEPRVEFMGDSYEVGAERVRTTDSWSLFPDWIARLYPGLEAFAPKGWRAPFTIAAVRPKHRHATRVIRRLSAEIKARLK